MIIFHPIASARKIFLSIIEVIDAKKDLNRNRHRHIPQMTLQNDESKKGYIVSEELSI